eukprot:bmy_00701T0
MTVRITTTCATSRPAGLDAARAGRGASGNCAPTGRRPAATSAGSRRSSSTASASVASASCSPGRAPVSPEIPIPEGPDKSIFSDSSCNCGPKGNSPCCSTELLFDIA